MSRPNLLYLTHRVPHPPNRGDRIRTFHVLQHLAARANVWLGCLADEPVSDESMRVLNGLCKHVAVFPISKYGRWIKAATSFVSGQTVSEGAFANSQLTNVIQKWSQQARFDVAWCSSSALSGYLNVPELANSRRFVDLIDVDSEKFFEYAAASSGVKRWLYRTEGQRLRCLEREIDRWADGLFVVSEPEARLYRSFHPRGRVHAIGNGVDIDYFSPQTPTAAENGCVFVGAFDYRPNIEGAIWFCQHVWPEVHRRHPDARFRIVGRAPVREVLALGQLPGVDVVGGVPDVRPWMVQAAVAVVPLLIARGIQNKVLEAFAMGKAVVATPDPLVGLDIVHGTHAFLAKTPNEWIEQLDQLLHDATLRREVGLAGQTWVTTHHRWEQCLEPLDALIGIQSSDRSYQVADEYQ